MSKIKEMMELEIIESMSAREINLTFNTLKNRITELEQQLANANNKLELMRGCVDRDSNCYLHMFDRAEAAEAKLTEREEQIQGLVEALERIGSVEIDGWEDNLAIILCSYFEDHPECPDQELDETGWKPWAVEKCNEMLSAISRNVTAYKEGK